MNKRLIVSVGLVAMGASAINIANADVLSASPAGRPWSAGVTLRGFYDDNYTTASSNKRDSLGFSVNPTIKLNLPLERTLITASYSLNYDYYTARANDGFAPDDIGHEFDLGLVHTFSDRMTAGLNDQFVIAQEPALIDPTGASPSRANGNNIRNSGGIWGNMQTGKRTYVQIGYNNTLIDYDQHGALTHPFLGVAILDEASRSGLLDRDEQLVTATAGYQISPALSVSANYRFGMTCYTGDELVAQVLLPTGVINYFSESRNSYSHFVTAGLNYSANEALKASLEAGIQYQDEYNQHTTSVSPYVSATVSYIYMENSVLKGGFEHSRNATDVIAPTPNGHITQDQESSRLYVDLNHQFTPKISVDANASAVFSTFNGGVADDETDKAYNVSVTAHYILTPHFGLEAGYIYDLLDSQIAGRDYDRNRITLGVTANY